MKKKIDWNQVAFWILMWGLVMVILDLKKTPYYLLVELIMI